MASASARLSVVAANNDEAARVLSQIKRVVRTNYSNPPTHGGQMVATVLASPELRALWEKELAGMRERIREMRQVLVAKLKAKAPAHDFGFVLKQRGMFSYSGLTKEQVRSPARRVFDLRRRHRPYLRGCAQHAQYRCRRRCDCGGAVSVPVKKTSISRK